MNWDSSLGSELDIKRVGKSGQFSLGKKYAGQYFREQRQDDGSIVLMPVVVVDKSHWSIRDQDKIRKAMAWAADNPPRESDVEIIASKAASAGIKGKRVK